MFIRFTDVMNISKVREREREDLFIIVNSQNKKPFQRRRFYFILFFESFQENKKEKKSIKLL